MPQKLKRIGGSSTKGFLKKGLATADAAAKLFKARMAADKPTGTKYKAETYMVVARWTENTKLKYGPNPKTPGSKSYPRYNKYMKAKTVGEALRLGAYPPDLLWDLERGFYKVVGGPIRDEPLDLKRAESEGQAVSDTDKTLAKWFLKEVCKELGTHHSKLTKEADLTESALSHGLRLLADRDAAKILNSCKQEQRAPKNEEVLQVLRKWSFNKNPWRVNVMKNGQTWVNSDTVGLSTGREGDVHAQRPTFMYPHVMKLMNKYIRDRQPPELKAQFHFTSINMNFGYGAKRHRDGNNVGCSMLAAFGNFQGGGLRYFPDDDKSVNKEELQKLPLKDGIIVDLSKNILLFDGTRCHEVMPFKGERYSLVWFTAARYWEAGKTTLKKLTDVGFEIPSNKSVAAVNDYLRKPGASKAKPGAGIWPSDASADREHRAKRRRVL